MSKRTVILLAIYAMTLATSSGVLSAGAKTTPPKTPEEAELRMQINIAGTDFRDRSRYKQQKDQLANPQWVPLDTEKDAAALVARRTGLLLADIRKMRFSSNKVGCFLPWERLFDLQSEVL